MLLNTVAGDPNLVNTFTIMRDITGNTQKMPPPINQSLKQGQTGQGQLEQAQAKYVDDHTKDERAKSVFTPKGFAGNPPIFTLIPSIPSPTAFQ